MSTPGTLVRLHDVIELHWEGYGGQVDLQAQVVGFTVQPGRPVSITLGPVHKEEK